MVVAVPPVRPSQVAPAPHGPVTAAAAEVRDTLTLALDADADAAREVLHRLQPLAGLVRSATALGVADRPAVTPAPRGASAPDALATVVAWRLDETRAVDVTCAVDVTPSDANRSYLTVRTRFAASPGVPAERLVEAYRVLGPLWEASLRRLATTVERAVQGEDELAA